MKIFIVDDHPLFIAGIRTLLNDEADFSIVGEAQSGEEAIEKIRQEIPDIVIMDISMPQMDGIEATRHILSEHKNINIIALSIHSGKRYVKEMLDAGAMGYLVKDSAPEELVLALKKVAKGEMYLSSVVTSIALAHDATETAEDGTKYLQILRTKLHRPSLSEDLILRTEIIQQLENNRSKPLTLVSAGAGYGKSISVSQWLENIECLHGWLSLDEEQNDLRIFLNYLVAAAENVAPGMLKEIRSFLQAAELPPLSLISQTLINELDAIDQEFILVLDDYHRIEQEQIHDLLNELLRFPPENMQLVLVTRRDPPLNLTNLRAHGRINEIRINQLRFNKEEIHTLFQKLYGMSLDTEITEMLFKKTEGWIAGMRLAALLVSEPEDIERLLASMKGDSRMISDFLVEEVLLKQPPHIQIYLLNTSILDRFCAELVEEINTVGVPDQEKKISGSDFINWLLKSNLFIVPLDDEEKWYRYHHLFQNLLKNQLNRHRNSDEIAELHSRASEWFERQGFIDDGIRQALAAGKSVKAAEIIERHRKTEMNQDRWYVITRWLDMLPEEIAQQRIAIMLAQVFSLFEKFRLLEMIPILDQIEAKLLTEKSEPSLEGEAKFYRGYISIYLHGDGKGAVKLLQEAKEQVPESDEMIRGEIELYLAMARQMTGEGELAIKSLEKKIRMENSPSAMIYSRLLGGLVFLHMHLGNLERAYSAARRLAKFGKQENLAYVETFAQYIAGNVNLHLFDLEQALKDFSSAIERKDFVNAKISVDIIAGLSLTCQFLGRTDQAMEIMERLVEFTEKTGESVHITVAESCKNRLLFMQGELKKTIEWARIFETDTHVPSMNFWLEIPVITQSRILIVAGTNDDAVRALGLLDSLGKQVDKLHNTNQKIEILVLQSVALEKLGRADEALTVLEEVVLLAEPGGWIRPFIEAGPGMSNMLTQLLEKDIARDYIEKLLDVFEKAGAQKIDQPVTAAPSKPVLQAEGLRVGEFEVLTHREQEVLTYLAKGYRNKEIASELFLSTETIKRHLYNIFQKLNVHSRVQAIAKSRELGLFSDR